MTANPLLDVLKSFIPAGGTISASQVLAFIDEALLDANNYHNFDAVNEQINKAHSTTILYSGSTGGVYNGSIATDLANRLGNDARVLDNTKIGPIFFCLYPRIAIFLSSIRLWMQLRVLHCWMI